MKEIEEKLKQACRLLLIGVLIVLVWPTRVAQVAPKKQAQIQMLMPVMTPRSIEPNQFTDWETPGLYAERGEK